MTFEVLCLQFTKSNLRVSLNPDLAPKELFLIKITTKIKNITQTAIMDAMELILFRIRANFIFICTQILIWH